MKVRFNDVVEFLTELETSCPQDNVIRATRQYCATQYAPIRSVFVLAGYINGSGQLVELKTFCGQDWGGQFEESEQTAKKGDAILEQIRLEAQRLGFAMRAGAFEEVNP